MLNDAVRNAAKQLIVNALNNSLPASVPEEARADIQQTNSVLAQSIIDAIMTLITNAETTAIFSKGDMVQAIGQEFRYVTQNVPGTISSHNLTSLLSASGGGNVTLKGKLQ